MAGGVDDADLNFSGDFAEGAAESIAAADALADALKRLTERAEAYRDPKMAQAGALREQVAEMDRLAAVQARIASFDPGRTRELAKQEAILRKMREDALGITEARAAAASQRESLAEDIAAANAISSAASGLFRAGVQLAEGAVKLTIAESTKGEIQGAVLGKLGGDFEQTVHMALRMGIDPDRAVEDTKQLLNAKFGATQIPTLLHIKAGMDLVREGSGEELLAKLEKMQLEPRVKTKDIESLAKLGIDAKEVYETLARKLGVDVPTAAARVKAGMVDTATAVAAVEDVAGRRFGAMADELAGSVPALAERARGDLVHMFDLGPEAMQPLKDVLKNGVDVLEGPEGAEVKAALKELVDEMNHAFLDEFRGDEGKARLKAFAHDMAGSIHELSTTVHELQPVIQLLERLATIWPKVDMAVRAVSNPLSIPGIAERLGADAGAPPPEANPLPPSSLWHQVDAEPAGKDMGEGLARGISAGESSAIEAAGNMAEKALQRAKDVLGIHSPSVAFGEVGDFSAEGMAQGMDAHPGPEVAGRAMATRALDAAAGGAAGAGAAGAVVAQGGRGGDGGDGGAGGDLNITVMVQGGGHAAAQTWQELEPIADAWWRRKQRDRAESGAALHG